MNRERWQRLPREIRTRNLLRALHGLESGDNADPETCRNLLALSLDDPDWPAQRSRLSDLMTILSGSSVDKSAYMGALARLENELGISRTDDGFLQPGIVGGATSPLPLTFLLVDLRSAFNVGAIFRTAECLGVERIDLCGYTATPAHPRVRHTAMGADLLVPWTNDPDPVAVIERNRAEGRRIVALETGPRSRNLFETSPRFPAALLLGNEALGLPDALLDLADDILALPLRGRKQSLNVGVAAAVAGFALARQFTD